MGGALLLGAGLIATLVPLEDSVGVNAGRRRRGNWVGIEVAGVEAVEEGIAVAVDKVGSAVEGDTCEPT